MSHVAVRIVADALESATIGVNAISAYTDFPRLGSDEQPPDVTVYDETQDPWVMRGLTPDDTDSLTGISFPAVIVTLQGIQWTGRTVVPGGVQADGVATIAVQLYLRASDTADGVTDSMYLARAMHNALMLFDSATDTTRTQAGTRLSESTAMNQVKMKAERGDLVIASAFVITYPVSETTLATS